LKLNVKASKQPTKIIWYKIPAKPESVKKRLTQSYEPVFFFYKDKDYYFNLEAVKKPYDEGTVKKIKRFLKKEKRLERINRGFTKDMYPEQKVKLPRMVDGHVPVSRLSEDLKKNPGDVLVITPSFADKALEEHYATFPQELVKFCLLAGCPRNGTVLDPFAGSGTVMRVAEKLRMNSVMIELNPDYAGFILKTAKKMSSQQKLSGEQVKVVFFTQKEVSQRLKQDF